MQNNYLQFPKRAEKMSKLAISNHFRDFQTQFPPKTHAALDACLSFNNLQILEACREDPSNLFHLNSES